MKMTIHTWIHARYFLSEAILMRLLMSSKEMPDFPPRHCVCFEGKSSRLLLPRFIFMLALLLLLLLLLLLSSLRLLLLLILFNTLIIVFSVINEKDANDETEKQSFPNSLLCIRVTFSSSKYCNAPNDMLLVFVSDAVSLLASVLLYCDSTWPVYIQL